MDNKSQVFHFQQRNYKKIKLVLDWNCRYQYELIILYIGIDIHIFIGIDMFFSRYVC